jgi:hypothetical protein
VQTNKARRISLPTHTPVLFDKRIQQDGAQTAITLRLAWLANVHVDHSASVSIQALVYCKTPAKPTAFECGKRNGPCGFDIPANVTCEKGPGWCQPGYYCGRNETDSWGGSSGPKLCKPVPKECGEAGHPCCPSNTDDPHGKDTPREQRLPFCRDGSSCFYERLSLPDIYASPYSGALGRLLQYSTVQYSTVQYSTVQYSTVIVGGDPKPRR